MTGLPGGGGVEPGRETFPSFEAFAGAAPPAPGDIVLFLMTHPPVLPDGALDALLPWTAADRERMAVFRVPEARTSWCLSRLLSRTVLSRFEGAAPADLRFGTGPAGKPFLVGSRFRFNQSHAAGCVALAVARGEEVGCDVEDAGRAVYGMDGIVDAYFAPAEKDWIASGGDEAGRRIRFVSLFVQKEAYLKLTGAGLSSPLSAAPASAKDFPFAEPGLACFLLEGRFLAAVRAEARQGRAARLEPLVRAFSWPE